MTPSEIRELNERINRYINDFLIIELEKRNIKLKYPYYSIKNGNHIEYIELIQVVKKVYDDKKTNEELLNNIIDYDNNKYRDFLERKEAKVKYGEDLKKLFMIINQLRRDNIDKINNENIKIITAGNLIDIYNKIYKDKINKFDKYKIRLKKDNYDWETGNIEYKDIIDTKETTFKGDNEPLKKIMKRFYIMMTNPNDKVLELIEDNIKV